jgi:two-component system, OmpR family, KDP operon response regulator KdpE
MTGLEVCRMIRGCFEGPIIIGSVRNAEHDKIAVLDSGADDYIVKPFSIGELLARIRATLRHLTPEKPQPRIELPGLLIGHEKLVQMVWGPDHGGDTENLWVVIKQLRKKIETSPAHPRYILTQPWTGYRFEIPKDYRTPPLLREP